MISREEVKKLLAKKSLTGHEAGRLWMEDSFLVVRGQKGLLTEKEHRYMRSLVRTQEDIEIYNSYLDLHRRAEMALKETEVLSLMAKGYLIDLALTIKEYLDLSVSSWNRPPDRLAINKDSLEIAKVVMLDTIKKALRMFMAYKIRMEDLSKETGVDFSYDIRNGLGSINYGLEKYNFYAEAPEIKAEKISLDKIKPDRKLLADLYEVVYKIPHKGRDQEASDGKEA
jgi:hypothetical protein